MKKRMNNLRSIFAGKRRIWLPVILALVVLAAVALTFFGIRNSARNRARRLDEEAAVKTVEKLLDAEKNNDYDSWKSTQWDFSENNAYTEFGGFGVLSLSVIKVRVSDEETRRIKKIYGGGEGEKSFGWSDDFVKNNMIAVYAHYTVSYDHTISFIDDGETKWYYYLVREDRDSPWLHWDTSSRAQATEKKD